MIFGFNFQLRTAEKKHRNRLINHAAFASLLIIKGGDFMQWLHSVSSNGLCGQSSFQIRFFAKSKRLVKDLLFSVLQLPAIVGLF